MSKNDILIKVNELYKVFGDNTNEALEMVKDGMSKDKLLEKCNVNSNSFLEGIKDPKIKDELKLVTQEAHDKKVFGAPTFIVNNKIFWGQDRLEFVLEEYDK